MSRNNVIALDSLPELMRLLGRDTGRKLGKIGLETAADLLHYYPRKYPRRGDFTPLDHGEAGEYVTYVARLKERSQRRVKNNTLTLTRLVFTDGRSDLVCAFFSKSRYTVNKTVQSLEVGDSAIVTGTIRLRWPRNGRDKPERELIHPEVAELEDPIDPAIDPEGAKAQAEQPLVIYPATKDVSSKVIASAVKTLLGPMQPEEIDDPVPAEVREKYGLMPLFDALRSIHFPATPAAVKAARATLRFHEAFVLQAALARRRQWADSFEATPRPYTPGGYLDRFDEILPFALTEGQKQVAREIHADLTGDRGMQRLLQGDVGSGKTVVALRAMTQVIDSGGQAALLAPTEVLAAQHHSTIETLLGPLAEEIGLTLLTGSLPTARRRQALLAAASGKAGIIIGTHALLSENVQFADLGLVVVDEQHRFGVAQRDALRAKADKVPHYLVMTATPIPRSVAMTVFGDVDTSYLRQLPAGRAEVTTHLVREDQAAWVARVWQRVAEEVAGGGRAYIVCPRIGEGEEAEGDLIATPEDEGEARPLTSVAELAEQLATSGPLQDVGIGIMHGRLSAEEKAAVMADFSAGITPVLVSTTVIEVGVDVPEATVMVIMDGHMFGLSQLHQLRGRIGRGNRPGVCLLVTPTMSPTAISRLTAFANTRDGFALAELDLEHRHEGDVLGRAQSGRATSLKLLRVMADTEVIENARTCAWEILARDPELTSHPALAAAVERVDEREEFLDRV